jgi:hypothetical protein
MERREVLENWDLNNENTKELHDKKKLKNWNFNQTFSGKHFNDHS